MNWQQNDPVTPDNISHPLQEWGVGAVGWRVYCRDSSLRQKTGKQTS